MNHLNRINTSAAAAVAAGILSLSCIANAYAAGATPSTTTAVKTYAVTNVASNGTLGDPANFVATIQLDPFATINAISWDVHLTANTPSWLSEMNVAISDSAGSAGIALTPAYTSYEAGSGHFVGSSDLGSDTFSVGADGVLRLEFFEAVNDPWLGPDGVWNSGTLTFNVATVPEPATYAMLLLGLMAVGVATRPRRAR